MRVEIEGFINWVRMRSPQARTWRDYRCDLALFMNVIGNPPMEGIRPRDVDGYVKFLIDKGYKPSTINRRLAAVASLFAYLIANGRQLSSPVIPRRHYVKEPRRLPRPVNEQELRKFFFAIRDARDRAMFSLMLRCGLRIGEVASLKMDDLYLGESPSRLILHGKGSRERAVYLSPEAEKDLQIWLESRPRVGCEYVFVSYQRRRLSTTSINVRVNRVCQASGVNLTAHRLRHTFADTLLSAGMPITSIQKLMGHRFVETTQTYAVANDRQVEDDFYAACERIEGWKILFGVGKAESLEGEAGMFSIVEHENSADHEIRAEPLKIPGSTSLLSPVLMEQLEAYRQLILHRWRPERVAANSRHFYQRHALMWNFFRDSCGVHSASDLRLEHVTRFIQQRIGLGRSASTVNGSLSLLRCFLAWLKEDEVEIHPSLENIKRLKDADRLPRYVSNGQVQRVREVMDAQLLNARGEDKKRDALLLRAVFHLLWQGGLRVGEVEGLRFTDFYISTANHAKRLFVRDGKWRKGRAIYLTDVQLDTLRAYLAVRGREPVAGYVFTRNHLPLKTGYLAQRLRAIGRQVSVVISPHRLRHTFGTQLLNVGCPVTSIQKLLGHESLNTTMVYARLSDQTVMLDYFKAVDAIENQPGGAWHAIDAPA